MVSKLCGLTLFLALALAAASVVRADTVYYRPANENGIASISGTIAQETSRFVEVVTEDGRTVAIPKQDVFQIVRGANAPPATADLDPRPSAPRRVHHYGFKGGMNIANMTVDPEELEDGDSLKSYAVGAWWNTPLNRRLSLHAEALYSVKGDAERDGDYTAATRMKYIDVPVLARIGFMNGGTAQPSLFFGPSLALNLSAHSTFEGNGTDVDVDVKDQTNGVDVGVVLGGALDFPIGQRTFGLEVRYSKGLTNAVGEDANGDARNDVLAFLGSVGLQ